MIASATAVVGIVRQVMTWDSFELSQLEAHGVPRLATFAPGKASSRKGWVARFDSFEKNPFLADVNLSQWKTRDGEFHSLRGLGREVIRLFRPSIERYADDLARESARFEAGRRAQGIDTPEITATNVAEADEVLRKPPSVEERPARSAISVVLHVTSLASGIVTGVMSNYLHSRLQLGVLICVGLITLGSGAYLFWRRL